MTSSGSARVPLTSLLADAPRGHPDFACLMADHEISELARKFIDDAWQCCAQYLDHDFVKRFPTEMHQRVWELRLCNAMLDLGLPIDAARGRSGPDFLIAARDGKPRTWVEAATAHHGDGPERVIEPSTRNSAIGFDESHAVLLRYTNALSGKLKQFEKARESGQVVDSDACVIAVNAGPIARAAWDPPGGEPPLIVQVLYALGDPFVRISLENRQERQYGRHVRAYVRKRDGVNVPSHFFIDPAHASISAVLFSGDPIWNCPEVQGGQSGQDFVLVHNVHASVPLPRGWIGRGREFIPIDDVLVPHDYRPDPREMTFDVEW